MYLEHICKGVAQASVTTSRYFARKLRFLKSAPAQQNEVAQRANLRKVALFHLSYIIMYFNELSYCRVEISRIRKIENVAKLK